MEERLIARQAIQELRDMKENGPLVPTSDIDMVWVLSAPGTYSSVTEDGMYSGRLADRERIDYGIKLVKSITALRIKEAKDVDENYTVTKEDIQEYGPLMFYNGEDATTQNVNYLQNEALKEAMNEEDFPLPKENVVIDHIDTIGTPAQIPGLIRFLRQHPEIKKVAVVTHAAHSRRVARYIESYKENHPDQFPENITFLNAWMPESVRTVGAILQEVKKVDLYAKKGDLSQDPIY